MWVLLGVDLLAEILINGGGRHAMCTVLELHAAVVAFLSSTAHTLCRSMPGAVHSTGLSKFLTRIDLI